MPLRQTALLQTLQLYVIFVDCLQALTDPEKVKHCRAVAERGLSDLQAYMGMQQQSGNMSITLKGATG